MRELTRDETKLVSGGECRPGDLCLPTVKVTAPRSNRPWEGSGMSPGEYYGYDSPTVIPTQAEDDSQEIPEWNYDPSPDDGIYGLDVSVADNGDVTFEVEVRGYYDLNGNGEMDAGKNLGHNSYLYPIVYWSGRMKRLCMIIGLACVCMPSLNAQENAEALASVQTKEAQEFYETAERFYDMGVLGWRRDELPIETASKKNQDRARICYIACLDVYSGHSRQDIKRISEKSSSRWAIQELDSHKQQFDKCWAQCDSILLDNVE